MVPTSYILLVRNVLKQHCTCSDSMLSSMIWLILCGMRGTCTWLYLSFSLWWTSPPTHFYKPINTSQVDIPPLHGRALLFLSTVTLSTGTKAPRDVYEFHDWKRKNFSCLVTVLEDIARAFYNISSKLVFQRRALCSTRRRDSNSGFMHDKPEASRASQTRRFIFSTELNLL